MSTGERTDLRLEGLDPDDDPGAREEAPAGAEERAPSAPASSDLQDGPVALDDIEKVDRTLPLCVC